MSLDIVVLAAMYGNVGYLTRACAGVGVCNSDQIVSDAVEYFFLTGNPPRAAR